MKLKQLIDKIDYTNGIRRILYRGDYKKFGSPLKENVNMRINIDLIKNKYGYYNSGGDRKKIEVLRNKYINDKKLNTRYFLSKERFQIINAQAQIKRKEAPSRNYAFENGESLHQSYSAFNPNDLVNSNQSINFSGSNHLNQLNSVSKASDEMRQLASSMTLLSTLEISSNPKEENLESIYPIRKRLIVLKGIKNNIENIISRPTSRDTSIIKDKKENQQREEDELHQVVKEVFFPRKFNANSSSSSVTNLKQVKLPFPNLIKHSKKPKLKVPSYSQLSI